MDCPDDLATFSVAERQAHLAECDICALESDFSRMDVPVDPRRARAIASRAMPEKRKPRTLFVGLAAAAALVAFSAFASSYLQPDPPPKASPSPPPIQSTGQPPKVEPTQAPPALSIDAPPARSLPISSTTKSAADLFAEANKARREGAFDDAEAKYRLLQKTHPKSHEAITSHVSLGLLLLDQKQNPSASIEQLDGYLADASHTELREQCLVGRARALGKLGRRDDERAAWKTLLREYPASLSADMARDRLAP